MYVKFIPGDFIVCWRMLIFSSWCYEVLYFILIKKKKFKFICNNLQWSPLARW